LQELDHVPIVETITKQATTATETAAIGIEIDKALRASRTPHRGPTFVDVPLDVFFAATDVAAPAPVDPAPLAGAPPDPDAITTVARLLGAAAQPVLFVGADAHWAGAEAALRDLAETARVPVFANGLGRGLLPADHPLAFSRVRSAAFRTADLVVVAGAPLDFRLGFGDFGAARVVHLCDAPVGVAGHAELAASTAGDLAVTFAALAEEVAHGAKPDHEPWLERLRGDEDARRAGEADALGSGATPISPTRVYGELRARLDRDAVVIGDGGDFVSYAGKYVDTYEPGCFLDPGPYGCLGMGTGYALAAALARPGTQVVVLFGDGAIGFSLGDLDTLVRFGVDVVAVVGNNGIWGLEKHPMNQVYGYDVVADLRPGTRYDLVAEALGGHGELVEDPDAIGPALDRAFATPGLSVVNVLTDPGEAYPRSSNLA
jgi:acetolactate synthase-1/2/3 large subunit